MKMQSVRTAENFSYCLLMCFRELEAQVQDLREVCQTSAADRAAAAAQRPAVLLPSVKLPPSLTPRSAAMLPLSGPVVVPSNLVNVMVPQPRCESSSSSNSPSPDRKFASDSRRSSNSSTESDVLVANGVVRQWASLKLRFERFQWMLYCTMNGSRRNLDSGFDRVNFY